MRSTSTRLGLERFSSATRVSGTALVCGMTVFETTSIQFTRFRFQTSSTAVHVASPSLPEWPYVSYEAMELHLFDADADCSSCSVLQHFPTIFEYLDTQQPPYIFICRKGQSRSVSVATAYILHRHRVPLADILSHIQSVNPKAQPNNGFIRELLSYEEFLLGEPSLDEEQYPPPILLHGTSLPEAAMCETDNDCESR